MGAETGTLHSGLGTTKMLRFVPQQSRIAMPSSTRSRPQAELSANARIKLGIMEIFKSCQTALASKFSATLEA